jgi:hypothetical protein
MIPIIPGPRNGEQASAMANVVKKHSIASELAWIPMDPFRVNKSVCSRSEIPEDFRVFLDKAWYRLTRMMDTRITPSGETPNEC